jgi:hypothetical protein
MARRQFIVQRPDQLGGAVGQVIAGRLRCLGLNVNYKFRCFQLISRECDDGRRQRRNHSCLRTPQSELTDMTRQRELTERGAYERLLCWRRPKLSHRGQNIHSRHQVLTPDKALTSSRYRDVIETTYSSSKHRPTSIDYQNGTAPPLKHRGFGITLIQVRRPSAPSVPRQRCIHYYLAFR